ALYLREVRPLLVSDASRGAVLLSMRGVRLSARMLARLVQSYARKAGIPFSDSTHALRHACATHLLKGGAGIRSIQEVLGHKSIETTEVYKRVAVSDLREVVRRHHPRSRRKRENRI